MRKLITLGLLLLAALALSGCNSIVVYDEYTDGFRYKPEFDIYYANSL